MFTAAVGTSASAPHVSGVAALILAQNPTLTAAALRQRIEQFATRRRDELVNNYGWGIVNAYNSHADQWPGDADAASGQRDDGGVEDHTRQRERHVHVHAADDRRVLHQAGDDERRCDDRSARAALRGPAGSVR